MLKQFYKTALIAIFGILSFQESFAQIPKNTYEVIGDTVCTNADSAAISVRGTRIGEKYFATINNMLINNPKESMGGTFVIMIPVSKLNIGKNRIDVSFLYTDYIQILDSADVLVNPPPRTDQRVVGSSYCPGELTTSIVIYGTRPGEIYEPNLNGMAIGAPVKSVTDTVLLTIPIINLPRGFNKIDIRASIAGCATVLLENKAYLNEMPIPDYFINVLSDVVCSSSGFAKITITGSYYKMFFQIYNEDEKLLDTFYGDSDTNVTTRKISTSLLNGGVNELKVNVSVNTTCSVISFYSKTQVIINVDPIFEAPILIGNTVTLPTSFATVTVDNPIPGVKYVAFDSNKLIGDSVVAISQNPFKLKIPVGSPNGLAVGSHEITVSFTSFGCEFKTVIGKTTIVVKPEVTTSIDDKLISSNFAVYPNPFSSEITITSKLKGQSRLQITDAIGNIVHQESISNAQDLKLNPNLKSGLYFLQMESEGVRETVKLIKQ